MSLGITTVNAGFIDPAWRYSFCDSSWRIYLNENDGAGIVTSNKRWPIAAGRVHVIPPWHAFSCFCQGVVDHFFMHFEIRGLTAAAIGILFPEPVRFDPDPLLEAEARNVRKRCCPPRLFGLVEQAIAKAYAWRICSILMSRLRPDYDNEIAHLAHVSDQIAPALQWVHDRLALPIFNEEMAEACCLSLKQFTKAFRQVTGFTPAQYVLDLRISRATHLMGTTDMSVNEVAERCGFPNRYYFTRAFVRKMNKSPARYRKQVRSVFVKGGGKEMG